MPCPETSWRWDVGISTHHSDVGEPHGYLPGLQFHHESTRQHRQTRAVFRKNGRRAAASIAPRRLTSLLSAGDTAKTVRDIIQHKLIGPWNDRGTGMILGDHLINVSPKAGIPEAAEILQVKHVSGGNSQCILKFYDQRREAFQGTEQDVIWLDEEPPMDVYIECLIRTMTNNGLILCTFTPLMGMSEVVTTLLAEAVDETSGTAMVTVTWDDVPHLTKEAKDELWRSLPPFQRDARSKGVPQLGSGVIYSLRVRWSSCCLRPFRGRCGLFLCPRRTSLCLGMAGLPACGTRLRRLRC